MTYPSLALAGTSGIGRIVWCDDVMVAPFGTVTLIGLWSFESCSVGAVGLT